MEAHGQLSERSGRPSGSRSPASYVIANTPYALSAVLGFFVLLPIHWAVAALELVAVVAGPLWMMRTVCPHCRHRSSVDCPSGYNRLSARLAPPGDPARFPEAFRRNIAAVFPIWFLPVAGAAYIVATGGVPPIVPLALFVALSFVIIPLKARLYNCRRCASRGECPWGIKAAKRRLRPEPECTTD